MGCEQAPRPNLPCSAPHAKPHTHPYLPRAQIRASARDRPRPLYHSTALNLGLHKARGQPCLLDYLLPPASPLPARRWLRRLLLLPPPPATAVAIHRACAILAGESGQLLMDAWVASCSTFLQACLATNTPETRRAAACACRPVGRPGCGAARACCLALSCGHHR